MTYSEVIKPPCRPLSDAPLINPCRRGRYQYGQSRFDGGGAGGIGRANSSVGVMTTQHNNYAVRTGTTYVFRTSAAAAATAAVKEEVIPGSDGGMTNGGANRAGERQSPQLKPGETCV